MYMFVSAIILATFAYFCSSEDQLNVGLKLGLALVASWGVYEAFAQLL